MRWAEGRGAVAVRDGLGMLVEQARKFLFWLACRRRTHRYLQTPAPQINRPCLVTLFERDVTLRTVWEKAYFIVCCPDLSCWGACIEVSAPEALGRHGAPAAIASRPHNDLVHDNGAHPNQYTIANGASVMRMVANRHVFTDRCNPPVSRASW